MNIIGWWAWAQERILHLDVNGRSGADVWFSSLLVQCRQGNLQEDDYNFSHGHPTVPESSSGITWTAIGKNSQDRINVNIVLITFGIIGESGLGLITLNVSTAGRNTKDELAC